MANARSIINQAARKIAVLGRGQTLGADEYQDALTNLNTMIGTFSTDVGLIFNNVTETFALTGAQSYTIGAGGDFNTGRPVIINTANIRIGTIDYPLNIVNEATYSAIGFKSITGIPDTLYYKDNFPLGSLFLYPVGVAGYSLTLYSQKVLDSFVDLTTEYDIIPGFKDLLVYNLSERLAAEYEKPVPPQVARMANKTILSVQASNKRNNYPTSTIDIAPSGSDGNIYGGWYTR